MWCIRKGKREVTDWFHTKDEVVCAGRELDILLRDPLPNYNGKNTLKQVVLKPEYSFLGGSHKVPFDLRDRILNGSRGLCHYCRRGVKRKNRTLDHKISLLLGGTCEESNLVMACFECNQQKDTMSAEEFLKLKTYARTYAKA